MIIDSESFPCPSACPFRRRCGILRGDECVALVKETRALLGFAAHLEQLVRGFVGCPAALRSHHAPEEIGHAAVRPGAFLRGRGTGDAALIVRPGAFALGFATPAVGSKRNHGGGSGELPFRVPAE